MSLERLLHIGCVLVLLGGRPVVAQQVSDPPSKSLPNTQLLTETRPLDEVMVAGIDRYALKAISQASRRRRAMEVSSGDRTESIEASRGVFSRLIGVVDQRLDANGIQYDASTEQTAKVAETDDVQIFAVRWRVLDGLDATGLLIRPRRGEVVARVVAIPDADWTPEMISGLGARGDGEANATAGEETSEPAIGKSLSGTDYALDFALMGCEVLVPTLISRGVAFSRNDEIGRSTNLTHREFIYRQAFEMGRHVIGYEVQKVLAAIDQFELRNESNDVPCIVAGVSEGGLLALYSAALDPRIDAAIVSGYFDQRNKVWQEPIYRNVWRLLKQHGDAELAAMIAPRQLFIEVAPKIPEAREAVQAGRNVAAPGVIQTPNAESVLTEVSRAQSLLKDEDTKKSIRLVGAADVTTPALQSGVVQACVQDICSTKRSLAAQRHQLKDQRLNFSATERQQEQVVQMVELTQELLRKSHRVRDARFANLDRSSVEAFVESANMERERVHDELFGKLPVPTIEPNPRTRLILEDEQMLGYEVMLDVYEDVIAAGILLLPRDLKSGDLKSGEKRPVVVCQHGLEGVPMDTISGPESRGFRAYKSFAAELCRRGFVVYAPQNPYRGGDRFRTLQRKSNPIGLSLFSYIIPQHQVTLRWLSGLENVDSERIGFYGLSYGGKTAVRVPPMLPKTDDEPGYCLSICSADYNEWVAKNASVDAKFSYVWTGEYEIFEWNMGHVANYAELAMLMTPRPFMVERGHDDGVGVDEWVAWEYAKVRRHYNKLGIGDSTEIEFFDGPHTINGQGTYKFLHRHLSWPESR
jgi:cephalosporin-C deacetylase-like acetyl esterase